ncbi:MAG: helix-turn-helix domain-containing protein [Clostridiales Family XIII bacterium]|jgi:transcriptional regulator with XRE-family HTH domain|nr:helix-turn-helix domain-containing protein [Clostridiales Family XIII bacterium]
MKDPLTLCIGKNMRKYRKLHNLTQEAVAEKLMLDVNYYSRCESAGRRLGFEKLVAFCNLFDITLSDIVPCNAETSSVNNSETYIAEINQLIKEYSDKQLINIIRFIKAIEE